MTFDDDFVQLTMQGGTKRYSCKDLGYTWPPPDEITWGGFLFEQIRRSQITDEQREGMSHVMRGAEYNVKEMEKNAA